MGGTVFTIDNVNMPQILATESDYIIAYKPPRFHSAPSGNSAASTNTGTMAEWCAGIFPELSCLSGRKAGEGGLFHRLDYETQGLMLFARTVKGMESLLTQQQNGVIHKEYSAIIKNTKGVSDIPGFPPVLPELPSWIYSGKNGAGDTGQAIINSSFRPYGPGRKAVRPVPVSISVDEKKRYATEILEVIPLSLGIISCRIGITRGFRHQIRCHLSWIKMPILNDRVYGGDAFGKGLLGLRAASLSFADPATGRPLVFSIDSLDPGDI